MSKRLRCFAAVASLLALASTLAFATPTALTVLNLKINNYAVQAGDLALTWTACDNVNGNSYVATGQEILLVQNSDGSNPHTFTVNSVPDPFGRSDTSLTNYSVAASAYATIQMKSLQGWISGTIITLNCSANTLKFAVVRYN